jgi:hypothetical protein
LRYNPVYALIDKRNAWWSDPLPAFVWIEGDMASATIRVPQTTRDILRDLSRHSGEPISELVARAVERLRREYFLEATNQAFASLREDPEVWQDELAERAEWDAALSDGQDDG